MPGAGASVTMSGAAGGWGSASGEDAPPPAPVFERLFPSLKERAATLPPFAFFNFAWGRGAINPATRANAPRLSGPPDPQLGAGPVLNEFAWRARDDRVRVDSWSGSRGKRC